MRDKPRRNKVIKGANHKAVAKRDRRIAAHDKMVAGMDDSERRAFTRPGSLNRRKR